MNLTAEQIQSNWNILIKYINTYISEDRKPQLIDFYNTYQERLMLMPASHKKEYHNSFPGGYIDHVIRVIKCSLKLHSLWEEMGVDTSTYTVEELVFSALNHDLGKIGDENEESYVPQTDQWRKDKLGENYMFNTKLAFASVPDRGLYLLQTHGVKYSFNEMIAIQTHDGLYDEANKKYLLGFTPEQKPRTSLPYILHQADLMAARIEFEKEWLHTFKTTKPQEKSKTFKIVDNKQSRQTKALGSLKNEGLKNLLDSL